MAEDAERPTGSDREEIVKSFQLVLRMIADQKLELETIRVCLRERGVTDDDFDLVRAELKRRWDASADAAIAQIKEHRAAERLRILLASAEGREQ